MGSETAKQGFKNERDIVSKFNNWKNDSEAKSWLITMQRKSGDNGRETAKMLQFKINPAELFDIKN